VTTAVIGLLALITAARPGLAQCPQLEPSFSITGVTNGTQTSTDQAVLKVGGCVALRLLIVAQPGGTTNVTFSPNTTFVLDPVRGKFTSKNVWCATAADCDKDLTIYGIYRDPCSGTTLVATVQLTVERCCPQLEPLVSIEEVRGGTINSRDQATLNVGGCVELELRVVAEPGGAITDVTDSPNTTFVSPGRGTISSDADGVNETGKNVFCATAADCNHQFAVYAIYHDPCTGTDLVTTVHITVTPCTAPS